MKRNNIFMFSYIIFIFLCSLIKLHYNFPMWGRIVVAVTSASWLFAISDCCSSISRLLKNYYETQFPLVDVAKFRINQIKKHLSKQVEEMKNDSTILTVESCDKRCINIIDSITNMNKLSDSLDKLSVILTFFAFLLFLCTLSFEPIFNYLFIRQEGLTVLSFGMILAAQFLTNIGNDYIDNAKKEFTAIISGWEALLHSYEMEEKHNAN